VQLQLCCVLESYFANLIPMMNALLKVWYVKEYELTHKPSE